MKVSAYLLSVVTLLLTACSSYPKFDMQISPSKELAKVYGYYPSVEVDVAGISSEDAIKISSYSVEKYFEPGNSVRKYFEPITLRFSESELGPKVIKGSSDEYETMMARKPTHILMIANLPFANKDAKELDPRIFIYKLDDGFFDSNSDMYIKIGATGLIRTNEFKAKEELPSAPETKDQPIQVKLKCEAKQGEKKMSCQEETNR